MISGVQDLDAAAVLAASEALLSRSRECEVDLLRLALQWADIHSTDPGEGRVMGADQLLDFGGEGTPKTRELCWGEFAISQQMGVIATKHLAADALDLRHRLPLVWEAVQALILPVWVARKVASMSRRLSKDAVEIVDIAVAAAAGQSPGRVLAIAEAKVIEADPEAHRAKVAKDAAEVGVRVSQPRPGSSVDEVEGEPGSTRVTWKLPPGVAIDACDSIEELADLILDHLPAEVAETITRGELQVMALELLTDPHRASAFLTDCDRPPPVTDTPTDHSTEGTTSEEPTAEPEPPTEPVPEPVPPPEPPPAEPYPEPDPGPEPEPGPLPAPKKKRPATIYVHLSDLVLLGLANGVARVEGIGPMLLEQLGDLLGNREVTMQPVIDLNHAHSVNGYEHPTLVKHRTLLRMLGDVFPHSTNAAYRRLDHDHATPYVPLDKSGPAGQTGDHNDAPLTRQHHRIKTHAGDGRGYDLRQLGLGTYRWVTPHGLGRLVTTTGTRRFQPIRTASGSIVGEIYDADTRPP
ncbi:hypothetical protein HNR19_003216 [Nocardioides thalensis]|uniref:DUF222 domain-containing protein n=1 Tax=Nocardioides thalensis TaxID=1914755 RepID=A0A853C7R5_9ACTN|nr:hypothetical protein [Nocardioides thalensis]NYJ02518.1 hypothetical protein [Nocardioides thalensis]